MSSAIRFDCEASISGFDSLLDFGLRVNESLTTAKFSDDRTDSNRSNWREGSVTSITPLVSLGDTWDDDDNRDHLGLVPTPTLMNQDKASGKGFNERIWLMLGLNGWPHRHRQGGSLIGAYWCFDQIRNPLIRCASISGVLLVCSMSFCDKE